LGNEETIELQPGQAASAILEGLTGPAPGVAWPSSTTLLVIPPGETQAASLPSTFSLCDPKIHPAVVNTTGGR